MVDAVAHGCGEDFAVGDIILPSAGNRLHAFYGEGQVGSDSFDMDFVGRLHQLFHGVHADVHFVVEMCIRDSSKPDPEEVFYMNQRGLTTADALGLITKSFAQTTFEKMGIEPEF